MKTDMMDKIPKKTHIFAVENLPYWNYSAFYIILRHFSNLYYLLFCKTKFRQAYDSFLMDPCLFKIMNNEICDYAVNKIAKIKTFQISLECRI